LAAAAAVVLAVVAAFGYFFWWVFIRHRPTTSTWATGRVCVSHGHDWLSRSWHDTYTVSAENLDFQIAPDDFDAIHSRARLISHDKNRYCFDGAAQCAGSILLRVESPRRNLIFYDACLPVVAPAAPAPDA
jgi:hypothetical protein